MKPINRYPTYGPRGCPRIHSEVARLGLWLKNNGLKENENIYIQLEDIDKYVSKL
jgi:hypothetical protein